VMMSALRSFAVIFSSSSLFPIPFAFSCGTARVLFELKSLVGLRWMVKSLVCDRVMWLLNVDNEKGSSG
jgi:hypothetical protein